MTKYEHFLGVLLVFYLLVIGIGAALLLIINFPNLNDGNLIFPHLDGDQPQFIPFGTIIHSSDSILLILAFLSGMAGSFLHAAQSLSTYIGNNRFKASWAIWYFLRPWIGGILGFAVYLVLRAGLIGGGSVVNINPYGVISLGILGGWFSKTTTDKLQEVFETLFKTDADENRKDKLNPDEKELKATDNPDNT
ncbi:hypothetical protein PCC8801_2158 [Rippkaea orientalis PCC 8801]|uniref:Uncharacterized protein n=1 Tax=Rippkaea orientalis (strain PCC 8801 / RF-1) TaxID=41431 RepID=B7K040_RIPO1|nr:hypothetical protein [Rippkaea orientalis]ACK66187.1 hypothetical protein PCC8801_2158 [Rippkaea orientalis PCC 8801]